MWRELEKQTKDETGQMNRQGDADRMQPLCVVCRGCWTKKKQKQQKNKQTLQVAFVDKTYQKNIANAKPGGAVHFDASP